MNSTQHIKLLFQAIKVAVNAGLEVLNIYNNPQADFNIEIKSDNSPLTIADKLSHELISRDLARTNIPILSEEGMHANYEERKNWQQYWCIDPIDGTKEFIKRNGEFTINIALIENNKPLLGVVYAPVLQLLFWGDANNKAYRFIGKEIPKTYNELLVNANLLPLPKSYEKYRVLTSRSYLNNETQAFIEHLKQELSVPVEIIPKGSSLKICLVASGEADIYPRFGKTMEWDTAAGHAIALATGRNIYQLHAIETELEYNKNNLLNPSFIVK